MVRLWVVGSFPNLNEVWSKAQGFTNLQRNNPVITLFGMLGEVKVLALLGEAVGMVFLDFWFPS
jgi:hypothetical protein